MKKAISLIMAVILILSTLSALGFLTAAASKTDGIPAPYKIVALKSMKTKRYFTCDIGKKNKDNRYSQMDEKDCRFFCKASKVGAYEKFEWIPCSDGRYALRTYIGRKYIAVDEKASFHLSDFADKWTKIKRIKSDGGEKLQFVKSKQYLREVDGKPGLTDNAKAASLFKIETVSSNAYSDTDIKELKSNEWFNLNEMGVGYWNIQKGIGDGSTNALKILGYTRMHLKDKTGKSTIEIDNMQCAAGVKKIGAGYDLIITFQGTSGYSDEMLGLENDRRDANSNLTGNTYSNSEGMHKGYYQMAKKLRTNENNVVAEINGKTLTLKSILTLAAKGQAHVTLLGHSMGGAIAQCYAIHLNKDYGIKRADITGRTFNSALAIDKDISGYSDWYNLCVSSDTVPNGLVPGSLIYYGIHRLGKTLWIYDDEPDKNLEKTAIETFTNILLKKHDMDQKLYAVLHDIAVKADKNGRGLSYNAADYVQQYVCTKAFTNDGDYSDWTDYSYDAKGNLIKEAYNRSFGYPWTLDYTYDKKGNQTSMTRTPLSNTGMFNYTNAYDADNNLTKRTEFHPGVFSTTNTYTYDAGGNLAKGICKSSTSYSNYSSTDTYIYGANANLNKRFLENTLIESYAYDPFGNIVNVTNKYLSYSTAYAYDAKGNLTKRISKDSNGRITDNFSYGYDTKGNLIKEVSKYSDGTTEYYTVYTYNAKSNLLKEVSRFADGSIYYISTYTYDAKGHLIKAVCSPSAGGTWYSTYTYDANGNMTKKIEEHGPEIYTTTYTYKKLKTPICVIEDHIRLSDYQYTYDGKEKKPLVFIDELQKGVDYRVYYADNVKPGKGKILIKFNNDAYLKNYGKSVTTIYFDIKAKKS